MATRAPIDLGRPGFSYGRTPPIVPDQRQPAGITLGDILQPTQAQQPDNRASARNYALGEVLSNPIQVESGSWGEAIAEALAGGIRGRTMRAERERELGREQEERSRARLLEDMQIGQAKQETADAQRQRGALDQYLQTLPEDERTRVLAGVEAPEQPRYQLDDYGRPYTIQNGQVQYGQGRVQMRPAGAGGGRQPPAGYRYTADGNLEPIPGGPADTRQTAEGQSRLAQMESSTRSLQNAIEVLRGAESLVSGSTAGLGGQLMRGIGGTEAYDLNQALEPVRAILSFENLQEMRRNSQTGGALGSIAVRELELLGSTVRSLDTAQSPAALRRAILETRTQLERTQRAIEAARAEMEAPASQGQQPRVIELDP